MAAMNIVSDLERMGDHAAGIARTALRIEWDQAPLPPVRIRRMARRCQSMLRESLQAFLARDAGWSRRIAAVDDDIHALYTRLFRELLASMIETPGQTAQASTCCSSDTIWSGSAIGRRTSPSASYLPPGSRCGSSTLSPTKPKALSKAFG